MKSIAFFHSMGFPGRSTLLYNLSWMLADMGISTVVIDLDLEAYLTSVFLPEERVEALWNGIDRADTLASTIGSVVRGNDTSVRVPRLELIGPNLALVPGDPGLAPMEEDLGALWHDAATGSPRGIQATAILHALVDLLAKKTGADVVLLETGPSLGPLTRCAVLAADALLLNLSGDLASHRTLRNLGEVVGKWRHGWAARRSSAPSGLGDLPQGRMNAAGYVCGIASALSSTFRQRRPIAAYQRWSDRIPAQFRRSLGLPEAPEGMSPLTDPLCLAVLPYYSTLQLLAMDAGKPIFHLKPADGAIGAHSAAVADCRRDFRQLASRLLEAVGLPLPAPGTS